MDHEVGHIKCPECGTLIEKWKIEVKRGEGIGYFTLHGFFAIESFQEIIDLHCPVEDCSFSLKDKTISELEDWFEKMREKD